VPLGRDANHVANSSASTPAEIDNLLRRAAHEFEGFPYRRFEVTSMTPPSFEVQLALEGYSCLEFLVFLLEKQLSGAAPASPDIRLVDNDTDRQALFRLSLSDVLEQGGDQKDSKFSHQHVQGGLEKSGQLRYWLASVDSIPVAHYFSWASIGGVGMVEDLFTRSDHRHLGIATALLHHCVSDCRARGSEAIALQAESLTTAKHMCVAMGFPPFAVVRSYWKSVASS